MRILITAPDRDLLDSLRALLTLNGWEVDVAHDGVGATGKARTVKYDAALVDEKTPLIRSGDLVRELEASGVPAILMTENAGAVGDAVIKYPFGPDELISAIEKVVRGKEKVKDE